MLDRYSKKLQINLRRLMLVVILVMMFVTWIADGFPIPLRITGGCMAPELSGEHREIICADCGFPFSCEAKIYDTFPNALCPNCGGMRTSLQQFPILEGDGVLVHRQAFRMRPPRRWEPVAFRLPDDPTMIAIKRIVGLPGETIRIVGGDIYVNDQLCRKNLADQRKIAILVHDADYRPTLNNQPVSCWQAADTDSKWTEETGRFTCKPSSKNKVDWLRFHNLRFDPNEPDQIVESPILNNYAYNQGLPLRSEEIHDVNDLMLSFRIDKIGSDGQLWIETTTGDETFQIEIEIAERKWSLRQSNKILEKGTIPDQLKLAAGTRFCASVIDRQVLFAIDDNELCIHQPKPMNLSISPTSPIFSIGANQSDISINEIKVYRDVYYSDEILTLVRSSPQDSYSMGPGEYYVLGTNCPISDDSRFWNNGPALPERLIVGRPFAVLFPSKRVELGKLRFQVPATGKIRYIR